MTRSISPRLLAVLLLGALTPRAQHAQDRAAGTGGAVRLAQELRFGTTSRRVLLIGAHPDDENTDLIAILARDLGAETAYLSLTRGEGGQNLIGDELGTALGVLRTEELAEARKIDGAQQFFTRAIDFGFSKSAPQSFAFWPHDELLSDVVAIIRRFKPQVVISVWSGTTADGHGQHQASGIVAREAYDAAGDASRFPAAGPAWRVAKFYRSQRGLGTDSVLTFDGGVLDVAVGQSLHQIAMHSRSQHRSQGQGRVEDVGPFSTRIRLEARAPGISGRDDSLFAGIRPEPRGPNDPHVAAVQLMQAGVVLDAYVDDDEVVPGQVLQGTLTVWNSGKEPIKVNAAPTAASGWVTKSEACATAPTDVAPGRVYSCRFTSTAGKSALLTTPYFLRKPLKGAFYQWEMPGNEWGYPFQSPELNARFTVTTARGTVTVDQPIPSRTSDPALGEIRHPVQLVPRVAVKMTPERTLWPVIGPRQHVFHLTMEHLARDSSIGTVSLRVPKGWAVSPPQTVRMFGEGNLLDAEFTVTIPATVSPGEYPVSAMVVVGSDTLTHGMYRIAYSYVEPRNVITDATAGVVIANIAVARAAAVGYIRGAADRVPEALRSTGVKFKLFNGTEAQHIPLDSLKVIVIGPRAYEVDKELGRANARLMQWVAAGGKLIVQYQGYGYINAGYAAHPMTYANPSDRVTEPNATVTLLDATNPLLQLPNRIGPDDFKDWVQERGLYFAHTWDPLWKPLLEMHDTGEPVHQGSLLVTTLGKGTVVYTGISFFRQLPAAVPGAWRLFMNLLAIGDR